MPVEAGSAPEYDLDKFLIGASQDVIDGGSAVPSTDGGELRDMGDHIEQERHVDILEEKDRPKSERTREDGPGPFESSNAAADSLPQPRVVIPVEKVSDFLDSRLGAGWRLGGAVLTARVSEFSFDQIYLVLNTMTRLVGQGQQLGAEEKTFAEAVLEASKGVVKHFIDAPSLIRVLTNSSVLRIVPRAAVKTALLERLAELLGMSARPSTADADK
ncbi:hypothetical protein T484DRAFT_1885248, partial [Baffinella frigidus]